MKFFRFNYQLIWEQQDQSAYIIFPQVLSESDLLPFMINNTNKHVHYRNPLSFNTTYFELITYDTNFIIEHSETSDNRPYTNPNFTSEPSPDEHNPHILQQNSSHANQNETTEIFQNQETTHFNTIPDPSETATIPNASEFSQETMNDPQ